MNCSDCQNAIFVDYGYSNYTVEGTDFYCGKSLHPDAPFDRFYGEEVKLAFADTCAGFVAGSAVVLCVDDGYDDLSAEQKALYTPEVFYQITRR